MLVNYKMTLQYDGTRYNGWQKQGNTKNTIQGKMEDILSRYFEQSVEVNGSGRTDAGVHALGQVANFKVELPKKSREQSADKGSEGLMDKLNSFLPEDIRIIDMESVDARFHARLNAVGKEYRYYVSLDRKRDVFGRKYMSVLEHSERLDIDRMRAAAQKLVGEHDFQGFSDNRSKKSTIRCIDSIDIRLNGRDEACGAHREEYMEKNIGTGNYVEFIFKGNGFLYHMVRLIVGTLLSIGMGDSDGNIIEEILERGDRRRVPYMAPAEGLFLYEVKY